MAKKKKKGLLGRLFGGGEGEAATPGADASADAADLTMAPGYAGAGADADLTIQPGYAGAGEAGGHFRPEKSGETGHVSFGSGRHARPEGMGNPQAAAPVLGPEAVQDVPDSAEMTMVPGYVGGGLANPFADSGAAAGGPPPGGAAPVADPFNFDSPEPADPFGSMGHDDPVDAVAAAPQGGAPDPFAAGEMTMAPGYAPQAGGAPLAQQPAAAAAGAPDPYDPGLAEMTLTPEYADEMGLGFNRDAIPGPPGGAAGAAAAPIDPFNFDAPDAAAAAGAAPAASAPLPDPFNFDLPEGSGGAPAAQPADPFAGAEMTMAPGYAQPGAPQPMPQPADPFAGADLTMAPGYAQPGGQAAAAPDPFAMDPFAATTPAGGVPPAVEAAALGAGLDPSDPFGPPLLDDPGPGAIANPLAAASADQEFIGERTLVDMPDDIQSLETLKSSTEELLIDDLGALAAGAPQAVAPQAPGGVPVAPVAPVARGRGRPMFAAAQPDATGTTLSNPAAEVVIDVARGVVFAPAVPGGWSAPAEFSTLSDGSVLGRGMVLDPTTVRVPRRPSLDQVVAQDDGLKLPPFAAGIKVDPSTGAVLVPVELESLLVWKPRETFRTEAGLCFLLPAGFRFDPDGSCLVPRAPEAAGAPQPAAPSAPGHPVHGALVETLAYLSLKEHVYADGWSRLEVPADVELGEGRLILPAAAVDRGDAPPPLLRFETLPDGRLSVALPERRRQEQDGLWLAPLPAVPEPAEVLFDVDSPVRDCQEYLGISDELLENGWVRLELPAGVQVVEGTLVVPGSYAALEQDREVLGAFDLDAQGNLRFSLPEGSEVLGSRVLIPPVGHVEQPTEGWATLPVSSQEKTVKKGFGSGPRKWMVEEVTSGDSGTSSRKKKKGSALDRFRSGKSEPKNDEMTFGGVLDGDADDETKLGKKDAKDDDSDAETKDDDSDAETKDDDSDADAKDDDSDAETKDDDSDADAKGDDSDADTKGDDSDDAEQAEKAASTRKKKARRKRKSKKKTKKK